MTKKKIFINHDVLTAIMAPRNASQALADLPLEKLAGEHVLADNPGESYDRRITLYPEQAGGKGTRAATIVGEIWVKGIDRLDPSSQEKLSLEQQAMLKESIAETVGQAADKKDRKSTRLNSSHIPLSRMPSSA